MESFEFGNLINDPSPRTHRFDNPVTTRYIRVEATEIAGNGASLAIAELDFYEKKIALIALGCLIVLGHSRKRAAL